MSASVVVRIALVAFVLAWILGPDVLRESVPLLAVFAIALGLELQFLVGALRGGGRRRTPDRSPQPVDRERYGFDLEEDDEEAAPSAPPPAPSPFRGFVVGLGVLAALGALAWVLDSRTGWSSLDGETKVAVVERLSAEASRLAEKPVSVGCDEARDYVGYVQHADGIAVVGGDRTYVTPEVCFALYRLAFEGEVRGSRTGRAIAVLVARVVAPPWRERRGDDRVLRAPVGRRAGAAARARRGHGAATDGTAAHGEPASRPADRRVPRVVGVP